MNFRLKHIQKIEYKELEYTTFLGKRIKYIGSFIDKHTYLKYSYRKHVLTGYDKDRSLSVQERFFEDFRANLQIQKLKIYFVYVEKYIFELLDQFQYSLPNQKKKWVIDDWHGQFEKTGNFWESDQKRISLAIKRELFDKTAECKQRNEEFNRKLDKSK